MLKKWSALFTVALNKGVLKEQIERDGNLGEEWIVLTSALF